MDVLIVDDEKSIRDSTMFALEADDHYAEAVDSGKVAVMRLKEEVFDLVLLDLRLGDENGLDVLKEIRKIAKNTSVVVFTAYATVATAVKAIHLGALDYLEKPFTPEQLRAILVRAEKQNRLSKEEVLQAPVASSNKNGSSSQSPDPQFVSNDSAMQGIYKTLFKAASSQASILILGESGTGKSVAAKAIHEQSHLNKKPFVTVHCPSLSKELLESELFGHVKGAFTGAVKDKWGKVHAADGGTLFLDEIGELPLDIQPKLLRLLQEREYERLGENTTRRADVRIIAATNRDLKKDIKEGEFREDLYYRLNVISVVMPSLRDRPDDLTHFAENFLSFFAKQSGRSIKRFSRSGLARLTGYSWPGNVRELRNAIERAVILADGDEIHSEDLPSPNSNSLDSSSDSDIQPGGDATLEQLEEEHLRRVLMRSKSLQEAAQTLGIDQATLYRKRKKLGLD